MKSLSLFVLAATMLSILSGCMREDSDTVDQDRIWANYELYYNGNEDKTYLRATFRFGHAFGTKLELIEPSEVRFNGEVLPFRPALAMYERSFPGVIESGTFTFEDINGNVYNNDVELRSIAHPEELPVIDRTQALAYPWDGGSVQQRETVNLSIEGGNGGGTETFNTSAIGATELVLGVSQLQNLSTGLGTVTIERVFAPTVQQSTDAGALITGRYRAADRTVTIE